VTRDPTGARSPVTRRPTPAQRRERRAAVDDPAEVVDAAARLLEARPRSAAEVRRRLAGAGYRAELVAAAVARLTELGYLDDEAFARSWVESRDRAHPRGERALRHELRLKGVEPSIIDAVLAERPGKGDAATTDGDADRVAAEGLIARNRRSLDRITDPRRRRQRAYALLARNGFDPSIAAEVARHEIASPDAATADEE
jgi:regulatory protein